jgi:hypothetical protein
MPQTCNCPSCDKPIRLPAGSAGKKIRCGGCGAIYPISAAEDGSLVLQAPHGTPAERACPSCAALMSASSAFCTDCGAAMDGSGGAPVAQAPAPAELGAAPTLVRGRGTAKFREKSARKSIGRARKILVALSILFALVGAGAGYKTKQDAAESKRIFAEIYQDDDIVDLGDGSTWKWGELKAQMDREVVTVFVIYFGLAVLMAGLYFWARRSPFPAMLTGLCVYLVLIVGSAIVDPASLLSGILLKGFIVLALLAGVQSALADRTAQRQADKLEEA